MKKLTLLIVLVLIGTACGDSTSNSVTLLTHDSFAVSDGVLEAFTAETGITVDVVRAGDAGAMVNQVILTKDNPIADVVYGIDNSLLPRALDARILDAYEPDGLRDVPDALEAGTDGRATPIDFGDVCINYDIAALQAEGDPVPRTLNDLLSPVFEDKLVVQDPSTSSPGLAFLLATVAEFGEPGWQEYWRGLVGNGVDVSPGWEPSYYGSFSLHGGDRPLVVSYASSPPAEVIFAAEPTDTAPTGVMTASCYRQIEYAAILEGSDAKDAARQLVDFMLDIEFQQDIPLTMFVFPANELAALPTEFIVHTSLPDQPLVLQPTAEDIERWIAEWADIVLR